MTGSAGNQPASCIAQTTSLVSPISPTFIGSPGMPCAVRRHHRQVGEALLVLVVRPQRRQHQIGRDRIGGQHEQQQLQISAAACDACAAGQVDLDVASRAHASRSMRRAHSAPRLAAAGGFGFLDRAEPARALGDLHLDLRIPAAGRLVKDAFAGAVDVALDGAVGRGRHRAGGGAPAGSRVHSPAASRRRARRSSCCATRQSHGAMNAPCHIPALASRAAFSSAS